MNGTRDFGFARQHTLALEMDRKRPPSATQGTTTKP
jgi:hypothetical protein